MAGSAERRDITAARDNDRTMLFAAEVHTHAIE